MSVDNVKHHLQKLVNRFLKRPLNFVVMISSNYKSELFNVLSMSICFFFFCPLVTQRITFLSGGFFLVLLIRWLMVMVKRCDLFCSWFSWDKYTICYCCEKLFDINIVGFLSRVYSRRIFAYIYIRSFTFS